MVFFVANDGLAMFEMWWDQDGWHGPATHGGSFLYEPVSIDAKEFGWCLFAVDVNHALHYKHKRNGPWGPFIRLGGCLIGPPAVCSRGTDTIDTFHIGTDHALYHKSWTNERWSPSEGFNKLSDMKFIHVPTAVSWGLNHIAVFAIGVDSTLYYAKWSARFGWYPFETLGGQWIGSPKAVSDKPGNIDVFGLNSEGSLNHISYAYSSWSPIRSMNGTWHSTPEVISWGPGRIDVFAVGFDGATYHIYWEGEWSNWTSLGGATIQPPKAESSSEGHISLRCVGTDGRLCQKWRNPGGNWSSVWENFESPSISRVG